MGIRKPSRAYEVQNDENAGGIPRNHKAISRACEPLNDNDMPHLHRGIQHTQEMGMCTRIFSEQSPYDVCVCDSMFGKLGNQGYHGIPLPHSVTWS